MRRLLKLRRTVLLIAAVLIHCSAQAAECIYPVMPDPIAERKLSDREHLAVERVRQTTIVDAYQTSVFKFVVCQRSEIEKRSAKLSPAAVRSAILDMSAAEDQVLAELASINSCYVSSTTDPAKAHKDCERFIGYMLDERRPRQRIESRSPVQEVNAYGGTWSYRSFGLGRPGECSDAPCDRLLAVEITNWTPVTLSCKATLNINTEYPERASPGEQTVTLNPGDSILMAPASAREDAATASPAVECRRALTLPSPPRVPEKCTVNWSPNNFQYSLGSWTFGRALIEFTAPATHGPPADMFVTYADDPRIGDAALSLFKQLIVRTNCAGQRFRVRIEYRAFPPLGPFQIGETGVVTVFRDE